MSLPYIKCPKCNEKSSPCDYWTCPNCGYSESRKSALLEESKDYEEEREKLIEIREEELKKWKGEQEELYRKVVKYLLPNQNINLSFVDYFPNSWGKSSYQENNLVKANQAKQRFTEIERLGFFGVNNLIIYSQEPSKIIISRQTLMTKQNTNAKYGLVGFLPTSAHESAHISPEVNHNLLYKPWINQGHDEVWRKVSERFYEKVKSKFGKEVEKRFKKLEEIKKEK